MLLKTALTIPLAYAGLLIFNLYAGTYVILSGLLIAGVYLNCIPFRVKTYPVYKGHNFISIIVPIKNEEDNISDCITYLRTLDYPLDKHEIILMNDNSTDNTLGVLKRLYLPQNFRIINRQRTEGFVAGVLNDGLTHINPQADIVGIVDSDCIVSPKILSKVNDVFGKDFKGACQIQEWHHNCTENWLTLVQHLLCIYENYGLQSEPFLKNGHFIHRKNIRPALYNEESILEDLNVTIDLQDRGAEIRSTYLPLIYRSFSASMYKVYRQQYRYALGRQLLFYKRQIIQWDVMLPLMAVMAVYTNTPSFPLVLFAVILLLVWTALRRFYNMTYTVLKDLYPIDKSSILKAQSSTLWHSPLNMCLTVLFAYGILMLRLMPFIKIPLSIEVIQW
jgi:1,2-diacylglycerol 3-beta-glucosyltransferase